MTGPWFDDVAVGTELPDLEIHPEYLDLVIYAGAARAYTSIHFDRDAALAAGHPDVILQGSLKAAWAGRLITRWLGDHGRLRKFQVEYRGTDVPGRTIRARGRVRGTWSDAGEELADIELWLETDSGQPTLRGSAWVSLPSRVQPRPSAMGDLAIS